MKSSVRLKMVKMAYFVIVSFREKMMIECYNGTQMYTNLFDNKELNWDIGRELCLYV